MTIAVFFIIFEGLFRGLYLVDHQGLLHVALKCVNVSFVLVCEVGSRQLELWKIIVGQSLLEELTADVFTDTVWVKELGQFQCAQLNKLLNA